MNEEQLMRWVKSANYYWMSEDYSVKECLEKTKPDNAQPGDFDKAYELFINTQL